MKIQLKILSQNKTETKNNDNFKNTKTMSSLFIYKTLSDILSLIQHGVKKNRI